MKIRNFTFITLVFMLISNAYAGVIINEKGKYGYTDEARGIIIPCKYDYMSDFSKKGIAIVQKKDKWGCINTDGKVILKLKYLYISAFEDGFAKISTKEGLGLINDNGKVVLPASFGFIKPFNKSGIAIIGTVDGKIGVMDTNCSTICGCGNKIAYYNQEFNRIDITSEMDTIPGLPDYFYLYDEEQFFYRKNGKSMCTRRSDVRNSLMNITYNCSGRDAIPEVCGWSDFKDGIAIITTTVNLIDDAGKVGVSMGYYNIVEDKFIGYVRFDKSKVDVKNGNMFSGTNVFKLYEFNNGYGCCSHIDKTGKKRSYIFDLNGNIVRKLGMAFGFNKEGYMIVQDSVSKKYGVINLNFEYVVEPKYSDISLYKQKAMVPPFGKILVKENNLWGEIDIDGNVIIPCKFKNVFYSSAKGLILYSTDGENYGIMMDNGKIISDCKYKDIYVSMSQNSFCATTAQESKKIRIYSTYTGKSSTESYDTFVDVIEANEEHGGQIFVLGTKSSNDTTYSVIDGNMNLIVDRLICVDDALSIANEESQMPFKQASAIEIKRLRLKKNMNTKKYPATYTLSEEEWDY